MEPDKPKCGAVLTEGLGAEPDKTKSKVCPPNQFNNNSKCNLQKKGTKITDESRNVYDAFNR